MVLEAMMDMGTWRARVRNGETVIGIVGMGYVGLPLALSLARLHGGSIALVSRPGGGSTFSLVVPLVD